ncbi:MAG: hypothetical protein J5483_00140 [Lachnospiraceae bacterium]|nr:hypothetical protein [Lachnospiraceae bacterium]
MKRILSIILVALMITALTACGGSTSEEGPQAPEDGISRLSPWTTQDDVVLTPVFSATIDEVVLADEKDVKVTAKELTYTEDTADLVLSVENNTDKKIRFKTYVGDDDSLVSVNQYMMSIWNDDPVEAGAQADITITFNKSRLLLCGITDIASIGISFVIKQGDEEYLSVDPAEIETSVSKSYKDKTMFRDAISSKSFLEENKSAIDFGSDAPLIDYLDMKALNGIVITDSSSTRGLILEVINNSEETRCVSLADPSVNGLAFSTSVNEVAIFPGKRALIGAAFSSLESEEMEMLGMTKYGSYACTYTVKDLDGEVLGTKEMQVIIDDTETHASYTGETLYDNNDVTIQYVSSEVEGSIWYSVDVTLFVTNNSDQKIKVTNKNDEVYVNDTQIPAATDAYVLRPGECGFFTTSIQGPTLETYDLLPEKIKEISTMFVIEDENGKIIDRQEIAITYGDENES